MMAGGLVLLMIVHGIDAQHHYDSFAEAAINRSGSARLRLPMVCRRLSRKLRNVTSGV